MEDTKESRPCRHNRAGTHMSSQRRRQHAQRLQRQMLDGVLELKGDVGTSPICKPQVIDNQLQMKISFYLRECYWGNKPFLSVVSMVISNRPTQNKHIFRIFLSYNLRLAVFFYLPYRPFVYMSWSPIFGFLCDFSVYECMSLHLCMFLMLFPWLFFLFVQSYSDLFVFDLSYHFFDFHLFSKERQKVYGSGCEGRQGEIGRSEVKVNCNQDILYENKIYFQ